MSALLKVDPVLFDGKTYTVFGFTNTVANVKGKGYGKKVVSAMLAYLKETGYSAIGFCMPGNLEFYKKCGLSGETNSTHRFVYKKGDAEIRNSDGQVIFFVDGSDGFMKNVLSDSSEVVYLPSDMLW